jgi:glyoxylase-like metal-dependent hydrolase (beta-lactamase superfamily II)
VSEPRAVADAVTEVVPGVWHWHLSDERIGGFIGAAHAVRSAGAVVLIDPLPLAEDSFVSLGQVEAIVLTTSVHQRSSWRLRRALDVRVWAPAAVKQVNEEPDERYAEGDMLPGELHAIFTPGAGTTQHSLLLGREGGVLFTPDLFARHEGEELSMVPGQYMHDPAEAWRTAEKLLELEFAVLCTGHGLPVTDDPKAAIRRALETFP